MAQPTDAEHHFEVSERSEALPVPTLSRYARPVERTATLEETSSDTEEAEAAEGPEAAHEPVTLPAGGTTDGVGLDPLLTETDAISLDPIVQPAGSTWTTDPSPPVTVSGGAHPDREAHPQVEHEARNPMLPSVARRGSQTQEPRKEARGGEKRPFWKRLTMARAATEPIPTVLPPDQLAPVIERIDYLARRFEHEQKSLKERLDLFEQNITRLWELEEQLSLNEVKERLAVLQANQEDIADGLHALARNVAIGVGLLFAALAAFIAVSFI